MSRIFGISKTYPHSLGLSTCFRQPYATSHCKDPHGYPLSFKLEFEASELDKDNWVLDFGGLKPVKNWLIETFDHRTALAVYDPLLPKFQALYNEAGFKPVLVLPRVGCEGFAEYVADNVIRIMSDIFISDQYRNLRLASVECREHEGNGGKIYL